MHTFSIAEIRTATNNFDENRVLGQGGYAKVYKGLIEKGVIIDGDHEITTVAIKRLNPTSGQGLREFQTEIAMVSKFRHCHILSLLGHCNHSELILVYEYMPGGTLADRLYKKNGEHGKPPLSWVERLKICIGAADGLNYLHTGTDLERRVIHADVKSSNILLDENLAAKVSDFGVSKLTPAGQSYYVSSYLRGTHGYMDPAYKETKMLTRKSDVYSFGVVLLEVMCGRAAVDLALPREERRLINWAKPFIEEETDKASQIIDESMEYEIWWSSLQVFVKLVNQCLHDKPTERPTMIQVVAQLERALLLQEKRDVDPSKDGDYICNVDYGDNDSSIQEEEISRGSNGHESSEYFTAQEQEQEGS